MPASTHTLPANNTDSFVFSMLSQHCDYVSPELEQAYLDPFVMMLTACAVPVLIRIADILVAAIRVVTAVASKCIKHVRPIKQKGPKKQDTEAHADATSPPKSPEPAPAASAAMGGAGDRVGATMDGSDSSAPATSAGDGDDNRISAGAKEQAETEEQRQDEPEEEAQEEQEAPHAAEDAQDREACEQRSDDGDETKAGSDGLEASGIEIVVASDGGGAQAQGPASDVAFVLADEVAKSKDQPRLYRVDVTVGTQDSWCVELRYSMLRALYTPGLRRKCGGLPFPPKILGVHSRAALASARSAGRGCVSSWRMFQQSRR